MSNKTNNKIPTLLINLWETTVARDIRAFGDRKVLIVSDGYDNLSGLIDNSRRYVLKNSPELPFEDKSYDIVILAYCLRKFSYPPALIKECQRLLTNRGFFIVLDTFKAPSGLGRRLYNKYVNEDTEGMSVLQKELLDVKNAREMLEGYFGMVLIKRKGFGMAASLPCSGIAKKA